MNNLAILVLKKSREFNKALLKKFMTEILALMERHIHILIMG